ncbi:MAG: dihydroorotate dehydrogenase electron transfer subunit [Actinomycetes bacterium]
MPVQVRGEVLSVKRVGEYHEMTIVAPGIAEHARPGQFVTLAVGGTPTSMLTRRAFSIFRVAERGVYGGTVQVVFAVTGAGTAWLAARRAHDSLDVVGPLGRPFSLPRDPASATLVGGGYGAAPLIWLGEVLRRRGARVDFVLGASRETRLFGSLDAKRMATTVAITTEDGTVGVRGRVTDVLPTLMTRANADVVYACGPMPMLAEVTRIAADRGASVQVAVEESMACGIGVCMTCVLPVVGEDGVIRMVRSCVQGPVMDGTRVRWEDIGTVPEGTWGTAPVAGATSVRSGSR